MALCKVATERWAYNLLEEWRIMVEGWRMLCLQDRTRAAYKQRKKPPLFWERRLPIITNLICFSTHASIENEKHPSSYCWSISPRKSTYRPTRIYKQHPSGRHTRTSPEISIYFLPLPQNNIFLRETSNFSTPSLLLSSSHLAYLHTSNSKHWMYCNKDQ